MKTTEELNALKKEVETVNKKLAELSEDELQQVSGGFVPPHIGPYEDENGKLHCPNCDGFLVLIDVPNLPMYQYCPYCKSEFGRR